MGRIADYVHSRSDFVVLDHHQCRPLPFPLVSNRPSLSTDISRISRISRNPPKLTLPCSHRLADFVFSAEDNLKSSTTLAVDVRTNVSTSLLSATNRARGNLVVDEWSCALQSSALDADVDKDGARETYCTGQMETYANGTAGWSFWSESQSVLSLPSDVLSIFFLIILSVSLVTDSRTPPI
jgi:hypothetical protein